MRTKFEVNFEAKQQKRELQERVTTELKRLMKEDHIEKLINCMDDQLISPIVVPGKRDASLKLSLDSKDLNEPVRKKKNQMPNIADQIVNSKKPGIVRFMDLWCAYGELLLDI